jgi:hypothetical protein
VPPEAGCKRQEGRSLPLAFKAQVARSSCAGYFLETPSRAAQARDKSVDIFDKNVVVSPRVRAPIGGDRVGSVSAPLQPTVRGRFVAPEAQGCAMAAVLQRLAASAFGRTSQLPRAFENGLACAAARAARRIFAPFFEVLTPPTRIVRWMSRRQRRQVPYPSERAARARGRRQSRWVQRVS